MKVNDMGDETTPLDQLVLARVRRHLFSTKDAIKLANTAENSLQLACANRMLADAAARSVQDIYALMDEVTRLRHEVAAIRTRRTTS